MLRFLNSLLWEESAVRQSSLSMDMMVHSADRAQRYPSHWCRGRILVPVRRSARLERAVPVRIPDMYFIRIDSNNGPVNVVQAVNLLGELPAGTFDEVEVEFVPFCRGGEFLGRGSGRGDGRRGGGWSGRKKRRWKEAGWRKRLRIRLGWTSSAESCEVSCCQRP